MVVLFITRKQHGGYGAGIIAKKINPVNRAELHPGVESAPCNQPLMPSADNAEQIYLVHRQRIDKLLYFILSLFFSLS